MNVGTRNQSMKFILKTYNYSEIVVPTFYKYCPVVYSSEWNLFTPTAYYTYCSSNYYNQTTYYYYDADYIYDPYYGY